MDATTKLPPGVRLGVNPLSWTNDVLADLGGDTPVEVCLAEAAAAGFDGVELGRKFPRTPEALGPLLAGYGLSLISGWYSGMLAARSVGEEQEAVRDHARLLQALGAEVMVYGECAMMASLDAPMSQRVILPSAEVPAYAARLEAFSDWLAGEYGLRLAYHHHLMMVTETWAELTQVLECAPGVGLLLDTGHAAGGGFDYAQVLTHFAERIMHIHLKDVRAEVMTSVRARDLSFNDGVRAGMFTVPGDGVLDFAPLARFVRDSYRGWLVVEAEQDPAKAPAAAAVARGRSHVLASFEGVPA